MNIEAFCYLGLLRFPEQLQSSMALLAEDEREAAGNLLATVKELPKSELLLRWSRLRAEEAATLQQKAHQQCGIGIDELPPSLREWWTSWLSDQNG